MKPDAPNAFLTLINRTPSGDQNIRYNIDAWKQYMINITNTKIMHDKQESNPIWKMDDQPIKWWLIIRMDSEYRKKEYRFYKYKNMENIWNDLNEKT